MNISARLVLIFCFSNRDMHERLPRTQAAKKKNFFSISKHVELVHEMQL